MLAQSCLTLFDPMDCSPLGSSVHGILQGRVLECIPIPFSRVCVCVCVCMYVRSQNTKILYNTLNKRLTSSMVPGTRILVFWLLIQCTLSILFFFFAFTYNFKIINITMRSISKLRHFELYNKYDIHVCLHIHIYLYIKLNIY